jgi:hypothetical protein
VTRAPCNGRAEPSSHHQPRRQRAGKWLAGVPSAVSAVTALLAVLGIINDIAMQCVAVCAVLTALPNELQIPPQGRWWIERLCLVLGGV